MHVRLYFHEYRYFPYERRLALRETQALLGSGTKVQNGIVHVSVPVARARLLRRLTYFSKAVTDMGQIIVPDQAKWEASANGGDDGWTAPRLRRQSTRYSLHRLHEYKGRFNPQIVRAIGNILRLKRGACVLDPFCGCGTTLLESAQIGWNAVGVDLNPLAVMIANAKVDLFRLGLKKFQESIQPVRDKVEALLGSVGSWDDPVEATFRSRLKTVGSCQSIGGLDYLEKWFPRDVLLQLRAILVLIGKVRDRTAKSALKACLSNILRGVSLQEPADLRIRRRKDPRDNYPAMLLFRDEVNRLLGSLRNTACLMNLVPQGTRQIALHRDSRLVHAIPDASKHLPTSDSLFDAAITSPPYANALPYIDTQRLSLVFLGLAKSNEIVGIDRTLTGSREITKSTRDSLELALERNEGELPSSVCGFLTDLLKKAVRPGIGFRRRNCPALLYRYFTDMKNVFAAIHGRLKKGAAFALVVGNNRTRLSGTEIVIPTPQLLSQVAASVGFVEECIEQLDTYHRYELHQANSINSESLLVLRLR